MISDASPVRSVPTVSMQAKKLSSFIVLIDSPEPRMFCYSRNGLHRQSTEILFSACRRFGNQKTVKADAVF